MITDLTAQEENRGGALDRSPHDVITAATEQANALMEIVEKQHLYAVIGDKKYLVAEAWETIGAFNRISALAEYTKPIEVDGEAIGYEAKIHLMKGETVVGSGIMSCGFDEFPCRGKEGFAKHRAAMSAAQTWATSKAYRLNYSWVAVLAGYQPTPAEEMDGGSRSSSPQHTTASVVGNDVVGIRRTCPTHGEDWHPEKKAGWGGFHPVSGGPICSLKTLLTELINQAATDAGKTTKDVNEWLKVQRYGSQTLSGLNVDEKCDVYDRIRGVTVDAPPGSETESPADTAAPGENEQGPPPMEEPPVEDAGLAVEETGALARLDNPGDLLNAAKDRFGRTNEEVCAALNVTEPGLITDLSGAWDQLVKLWG